jgi:hypothetical protein
MSTLILRPRVHSMLVLGLLMVGLVWLRAPITNASGSAALSFKHPWQHEQIGAWSCRGVNTLKDGTEQPYVGRLTNVQINDPAALIVRFDETETPTRPFREHQAWVYLPGIGVHLRALLTNDGSYSLLIADEPHANAMQWDGPFVTPAGTYHLSETLTKISSAEYEWYGTLARGGQQAGYYRVTCKPSAD